MRIKKMVKRLFAVGAGVTMLGATAMGALAADLNQYPSNFVDGGTFNGFFVVGENAAAVDNLAMTDMAANMKVAGSGSSSTTVSGDAWMVGTSSKKLELANNDNATTSNVGGETFRDIVTFMGDEELGALADSAWNTNENEYGYQQFLFFDSEGEGSTTCVKCSTIVKYVENDDDVSADFLYFRNGNQLARYKLEFTSTAQSDITDSAGAASATGTYLDDFEDTTLTLLGNEYTVVQARRPNTGTRGGEDSIKLVLMAGATSGTLLEGESQDYTIKGKAYSVALTYVDATTAKFTVNGEATNKLQDGATYVLADGTEIGVSDVLYQSYAGGIHSASFFLGASKLELRDDDVVAATSTHEMKVGSETIDGADVFITGTDDNTTFSISTIEINMTSQDEFFVGAGEKLSDAIAAQDEEKELLMAGGFDIEYSGLTEEETHDIRLKTASTRRYKLGLFDGDNNAVDLPVAYAEGTFNLTLGEDSAANARGSDKRLVIYEGQDIYKDDYFVVSSGDASSGAAKSYLLQYKGADRTSKTSPIIKFKNIGTGKTLEYAVTANTSATATLATIKLGGNSFLVQYASPNTADDFQIDVDLNGGGGTITAATVNFVDYYGSVWEIGGNYTGVKGLAAGDINYNQTQILANESFVTITQTTPNGDDYDDKAPGNLVLNITSVAGPELRATLDNYTLTTPDGETEVSYGYTSMGAFITFNEPSGDPDEFTLTYPKKQRLPQVYFTSGSTTTATSSSGSLTAVSVGVATKLDTEIADHKAQNLIVLGGPCVNSVSAALLGNPTDCTEGFRPGVARVKLFEHANGNLAMLVAGYSGADTRLAGSVIANRWTELSGMEVEIEGTTASDATIGAPMKAKVVVEEVMEEVTE
jgi:hypothetical protein